MPILRMAWGRVLAGTWDQYQAIYKNKIESTVKTIDGLQVRELLRSTEDPDEGVQVTVWATEEDMNNYMGSEVHRSLVKETDHLHKGEYWVKFFDFDSSRQTEYKP